MILISFLSRRTKICNDWKFEIKNWLWVCATGFLIYLCQPRILFFISYFHSLNSKEILGYSSSIYRIYCSEPFFLWRHRLRTAPFGALSLQYHISNWVAVRESQPICSHIPSISAIPFANTSWSLRAQCTRYLHIILRARKVHYSLWIY